jgi:ribosomal protein L11 methyltransferase
LLLIDAATAFGSGEHGTTAGCLDALLDLKREGFTPAQTLDVGTGSGILAIAAWKTLWADRCWRPISILESVARERATMHR